MALYKKEITRDFLKNETENEVLIGKGTYNIITALKKAISNPLPIVIDLIYDFDNKVAGQANLEI